MEQPLKSRTYNDRKKVVTHNNLLTADFFVYVVRHITLKTPFYKIHLQKTNSKNFFLHIIYK